MHIPGEGWVLEDFGVQRDYYFVGSVSESGLILHSLDSVVGGASLMIMALHGLVH